MPVNRGSLKRRLLRRTPLLWRLAKSLDALEAENRELHAKLAPVLLSRDGGRQDPATSVDEDGVPIPPAHLRFWVAGTDEVKWFLEVGKLGATTVTSLLARHGVDTGNMESLLDFGCGCGRVLRHLRTLTNVRLHGTDSNAAAIAWCDQHLDFAEFGTNRLEPPTRYRQHSFDAIYAFSVFTHLTEPLQLAWMDELGRILKPGGHLLITLHGDHYLPNISKHVRARYQRGEMVVMGEEVVGENRCAAFHPESYVRSTLARGYVDRR